MTSNTDTLPDSDLPGAASQAEDPPAKPARKRRTPKAAAAAEADAVAAVEPVVEQPPVDAPAEPVAEEAPKKRRAAPRKKVAVEAEAVAVEPAPAPVDTAPPAVAVEAALPVSAPPVVAAEAVAAEPAAAPAEGDAPVEPQSGEAGPDGPRSERGRRRGRRDRKRGERDDAASAVEGASSNTPDVDSDSDSDDEAASEAEGVDTTPRPAPVEVGELFAQVQSGEFDEAGEPLPEEAGAEAGPTKRVLLPEPEAPKLHKVLAQAGIGSRRDMEELILDGKITVNGEPAHIGQRISFGDRIAVGGKPVRVRIMPPPPRIIAYHKPVGEVVTHDDPQHRPTVFRRLPRLPQGKWQSVGRLDINTEGLLLFTNSGELANQLMHPRFGVEREYAVRVLGTLETPQKAKLLEGVEIDGQAASFKAIEEGGGEGLNRWYRVVITEGRNREVRKLFDAVGLTVSRLIRIRYGTVVLPRGLKRGVWVDLEEGDVRAIRRLAGGESAQRGGPQGQERQGQQPRPQQGAGNGQKVRGNDRNRPNDRPNDRPSERGNDRGNERGNDRQRGANNNRGPRPGEERAAPPQAAVAERAFERDDDNELDFDPRNIPNPMEQTFDKRFVQNPRSPAGGRGFRQGGGGFGAGGSAPPAAPKAKPGAPREPDPLQTSVGYIGADAFHRKGNRSGGGGGGGGGNRGGSRSGGGGGGFGGGGGGRRGR